MGGWGGIGQDEGGGGRRKRTIIEIIDTMLCI